MAAAEASGRIRATTLIPRLNELLDDDPTAEVRLHAAESLAVLGENDIAARIPQVVEDVGWRVRGHARWKRLKEFAESGQSLQQ
jgi:HEAT repeat protein